MESKQLKILVIGAHPDDCELKTGGTAIRFRAMGHVVKYVYATSGDAGHHEHGGAKLAAIRAQEVAAGCGVAGLDYLIMDNHDGHLEVTLHMREKFITLIRSYAPDILITHRPNDYHPDHRNTALLVQDASYLITVPNICPLTPPLRKQPVILYMCDSFRKPALFTPDILVDIDAVMARKIRMLDCHGSQFYEWLPWNREEMHLVPKGREERVEWLSDLQKKRDGRTADRFREVLREKYGSERGDRIICAEAFEISEYGRQMTQEDIDCYFPF